MPIRYRGYGEISYGDINSALGAYGVYVFPPTYTLSFNVKPIMSDNGVGVKYNRNELTISWVLPYEMVTPRYNPNITPQSVDTAVQQIKAILMQPGKTLTCTYQGLGPEPSETTAGLVVSASTDKAGGPLPLDFKWKVLATQRCVEMSWTVAFHSTNCITFNENNQIVFAAPAAGSINEFIWSRSYDLDELGAVTITTTGRIERSDYGPGNHIDQWRVLAAFKVPIYCHRISQKFQHDPTTRITNFTLVDKEHSSTENALPPMVQSMDLSHEMSSAAQGAGKFAGAGFYSWNNTFSGNITLLPNVSPVYAYFVFHFYLRQRMNRVMSDGVAPGGNIFIPNEQQRGRVEKVRTVLTRISYKESLFSRTHSFKAEYFAIYDRKKFIGQSGIFLPLYNYGQAAGSKEYKDWFNLGDFDSEPWKQEFDRSSTKGENAISAQLLKRYIYNTNNLNQGNPYGYLYFREDPYSGANIFIPCDAQDIVTSQNPNTPYIPDLKYAAKGAASIEGSVESDPSYEKSNKDRIYNTITKTTQTGEVIDPEVSWIDYEINTTVIENHNTAQIVRQSYDNNVKLGLQSYHGQGKPDKQTTTFMINNGGASGVDPPPDEVVSTFNGQSNTVVLLTGYAIRVGYPCPMPTILSYKNNKVYRAGQAMYSNRIISKGEIPIYLATWSIPYYIDQTQHADVFEQLSVNGYTGDLG